ncbi:MAG: hypothetical protein NVSMB66_5390 [Candidatus Doudnabacteria bacterium]
MIAQIILQDNPGAKIGYDIRPGKITKDMILSAGGVPVLTPVGHSLIKNIMVEQNLAFAGESSGHYCFRMEYGTFEAPMVLVSKLLRYISVQNKTLSEIVLPYKKYYHSGEINIKLSSKELAERKLEEIKEKYSDGEINLLDGVSVEYPDYWFNVRLSNTEPLIRFAVEGVSRDIVQTKTEELNKLITA